MKNYKNKSVLSQGDISAIKSNRNRSNIKRSTSNDSKAVKFANQVIIDHRTFILQQNKTHDTSLLLKQSSTDQLKVKSRQNILINHIKSENNHNNQTMNKSSSFCPVVCQSIVPLSSIKNESTNQYPASNFNKITTSEINNLNIHSAKSRNIVILNEKSVNNDNSSIRHQHKKSFCNSTTDNLKDIVYMKTDPRRTFNRSVSCINHINQSQSTIADFPKKKKEINLNSTGFQNLFQNFKYPNKKYENPLQKILKEIYKPSIRNQLKLRNAKKKKNCLNVFDYQKNLINSLDDIPREVQLNLAKRMRKIRITCFQATSHIKHDSSDLREIEEKEKTIIDEINVYNRAYKKLFKEANNTCRKGNRDILPEIKFSQFSKGPPIREIIPVIPNKMDVNKPVKREQKKEEVK